ncbi:glycoside hydrolase family 3 N-terminal domain-containing protein [Paenibacillus sp. G2S3]|uniref:glycoside hydrolase family 3 protein n=1 Tax=Paenibacillus sp. G2S3 TaxID=3047872 RepID=UPI0024C185AC|nr:glycoside hydrolase family 3 N-terminal domain-containing protein [Paenibacillus sp. G2S3]WHY20034.1 glycoside hydrolase family 3 N-terminal domain-containing protein [Paenibacillus sp. G2S3]
MLHQVDLTKKPFNLNEQDITWVQETLEGLTLEEKVGQLFCPVGMGDNAALIDMVKKYQPGGLMYRPGPANEIRSAHKAMQENSKIPMLLAANLENGGDGVATEGTYFGKQLQVAATNDPDMAYKLGTVACSEGRAVGLNWSFGPIVDINMNFRNPITNVRTFGDRPETVLDMGLAYMKAAHENGMAVSIKHFPGDGVDDRDQHLLTSINSLSTEEWDATFGHVYQTLIDEGANTVMVGHIMQPAYQRHFNPELKDEDLLPSSLSSEILQNLLREKMNFNGVIVSDATLMAGFTIAERRELAVPKAIAAGCDIFLFNRNFEEDLEYMLSGIRNGILTEERLNQAVTRILGLKASLRLHEQARTNTLVPDESALAVIGSEQHHQWAQACADQSVTLVKDTQQLLPVTPETHKRMLLVVLGDEEGSFSAGGTHKPFVEKLRTAGFEVTVHHPMDMQAMFMSVRDYVKQYDFALYFANYATASNKTDLRINYTPPYGGDIPWFIKELPTMFISVANPFHLQDVPRIPTFINAYSGNEYSLNAIVDKIQGKSEFKGTNPVDPFCGYWEARL